MEKLMRNAPTASVIVVLIIQLTRVSDFGQRIGAGWLSFIYALFLGTTIFVLSYWDGRLEYHVTATKEEHAKYVQQKRMERLHSDARSSARFWLVLFLFIDGALNFFETMSALPAGISAWQYYGAMVYGVFPTLAAYGLGSLQALLDKIPQGVSKPSIIGKLADKLLARLDEPASNIAQAGQQVDKTQRKVALQDSYLLAYWEQHPQASDNELAQHFHVSRQAIQQRRKSLIQRGAFMQPMKEKVQP